MVASTSAGSQWSIRWRGAPGQHRGQQTAQHADGVADRGGHQRRAGVGGHPRDQLAGLGQGGVVRVDHALGIGGGARRVADQHRGVGRHLGRAGHRLGFGQLLEPVPLRRRRAGRAGGGAGTDHEHLLEASARWPPRPGWPGSRIPPKRDGDDQGAHPGLAQDVAQLLGAVDVHDGDDHRAQQGAGVEGDRALHPVRASGRPARRPGPRRRRAGRRPPGGPARRSRRRSRTRVARGSGR